jgi:ABC-type Na+ efflux pump permease subunit
MSLLRAELSDAFHLIRAGLSKLIGGLLLLALIPIVAGALGLSAVLMAGEAIWAKLKA